MCSQAWLYENLTSLSQKHGCKMSNAGQWTNVDQLPDGTVIVTMVSVNMQCVFSAETAVSYGVQSCLALKGMGHMALMCTASLPGTRGGCVKAPVCNCKIMQVLSLQLSPLECLLNYQFFLICLKIFFNPQPI